MLRRHFAFHFKAQVRYGAFDPGKGRLKISQEMSRMTDNTAVGLSAGEAPADRTTKRREIVMFLLLAFVIWPFVAVAVVGGYGFIVWMYQTIAGPPGPPPV